MYATKRWQKVICGIGVRSNSHFEGELVVIRVTKICIKCSKQCLLNMDVLILIKRPVVFALTYFDLKIDNLTFMSINFLVQMLQCAETLFLCNSF